MSRCRQECLHFLDCVRTGATPRTDGREGLRVLRVLARAAEALPEHASNGAAPCRTPRRVVTEAARGRRPIPGVTIHETAYVDEGVEIGAGTQDLALQPHPRRRHASAASVHLGQNVVIGPDVTVGDSCKIQNNVCLYEGVTLEDGVFCGPSCVFTNVNNPRAEIERKSEFRPTLVKRGATIGANATIVCGHTLGEYCLHRAPAPSSPRTCRPSR